jgi:hypothetical protein
MVDRISVGQIHEEGEEIGLKETEILDLFDETIKD